MAPHFGVLGFPGDRNGKNLDERVEPSLSVKIHAIVLINKLVKVSSFC